MRTRNIFFLVSVIVIISVSLFLQAKLSYTETSDVPNSKVDLSVSTTTSPGVTTSQTISKIELSDVSKKDDSVVKTFKLDVPYFHQQYANSCEAASLRMALAYYDIKISDDMDIVQKFGYKPRDKNTVLDEWDNPQEMFVGNIDIVGSTKGYGVYGKPVVKAAKIYGRDASYETNITPQILSSEIKSGHPIVFWGYTSITAPAYTWNLAGGGEVKAFKGEHARVMIGFTGDVDNPTGFYVHDPFNGKKSEYWTVEKLMKHVYAVPGVTNQMVIVK